MKKLYIAILDEVPDFIVPTLVAHAVLGAHLVFEKDESYIDWISNSFRKCTVSVNRKEFNKIKEISNIYLAHENKTLNGEKSCIVICPMEQDVLPNVLKFAKLWKPKVND